MTKRVMVKPHGVVWLGDQATRHGRVLAGLAFAWWKSGVSGPRIRQELAFRKVIDKNVSPDELIKLAQRKAGRPKKVGHI